MDTMITQRNYYLTHGLHTILGMLPIEGRLRVTARIDKLQRWIRCLPTGPVRARVIHERMDQAIAEDQSQRSRLWKKAQCKAGCSACCHLMVEVTNDEADLLADRVRSGLGVDLDRLRVQASAKDKSEHFRGIPFDQSACVFLSKTGRCKVYEDRPLACRKYYVTSPSASCEPTPSGRAQTVTFVGIPEAEVLATAALDLDSGRGPLSKLLLERLEDRA